MYVHSSAVVIEIVYVHSSAVEIEIVCVHSSAVVIEIKSWLNMCQISVLLHRFYHRGHIYTVQLLQNIPVSYFEKYLLGMNI